MTYFDYEILYKCQYEVDGIDCGEPAIANGWWYTERGTLDTVIHLCKKHLDFIIEKEKEER